jgi:hypothetical protein
MCSMEYVLIYKQMEDLVGLVLSKKRGATHLCGLLCLPAWRL